MIMAEHKIRFVGRLPYIFMAACLLLCGCSRSANTEKDIVAYVNKDPISRPELMRDIALKAKFDPQFRLTPDSEAQILDSMIDRKLIIQNAMKKGLAREERFVSTIKAIWEHTLIRDFIDYKKRQMQDYLFATDEEVKRYYDNMSVKAAFRIFRSRDARAADEAYEAFLKDGDTSRWQALGPVSYEDIESAPLIEAFELAKGQGGRFSDGFYEYAVVVSDKEPSEVQPLDKISDDVKRRVIAMKERRLFEEWLKNEKKAAKITITKPVAR